MAENARKHDEAIEVFRNEHSSEMDGYVADWQARLEAVEAQVRLNIYVHASKNMHLCTCIYVHACTSVYMPTFMYVYAFYI